MMKLALMNGQVTSGPTLLRQRVSKLLRESEGCFMFCYNRHGKVAGDYWFSTLEDAKMQAKHEFGVAEEDWRTRTEEKTPIFLTWSENTLHI